MALKPTMPRSVAQSSRAFFTFDTFLHAVHSWLKSLMSPISKLAVSSLTACPTTSRYPYTNWRRAR